MSGKHEAQTTSYLRNWSKCQSRRLGFLLQQMKMNVLCLHYWSEQKSTEAWRSVCCCHCALSQGETVFFPSAPHLKLYLYSHSCTQLHSPQCTTFHTNPPKLLAAHCLIPLPLVLLQTGALVMYERAACSVTWLSSWQFSSICKMELIIPLSTACCTF